jgi:hypothetical protein
MPVETIKLRPLAIRRPHQNSRDNAGYGPTENVAHKVSSGDIYEVTSDNGI